MNKPNMTFLPAIVLLSVSLFAMEPKGFCNWNGVNVIVLPFWLFVIGMFLYPLTKAIHDKN